MIGLISFLTIAGIDLNTSDTKVHLACWNGREHPRNVFFAGNFQQWQEGQSKRNFQCSQIISLIDLGQGQWLFAGVYQVLDCQITSDQRNPYRYETELLPGQHELVGRIVVSHQRSGRACYIWYKPDLELPLVEFRRERMSIRDFPGYNTVVVNHAELQIIVRQEISSWHSALINVRGVYLITDTRTGKHYVGKASGNEGIWQRWCAYAKNGHGGNVELKKLLASKGSRYVSHFQYSILEIADTHTSDAVILTRESHWMSVLKTREFGLNS